MHPRTREVRRPDSGIDPRGSGSGQPPLLQGFLKHRKPGAGPQGAAPGPAAAASPAPEVPEATAKSSKATTKPRKARPKV